MHCLVRIKRRWIKQSQTIKPWFRESSHISCHAFAYAIWRTLRHIWLVGVWDLMMLIDRNAHCSHVFLGWNKAHIKIIKSLDMTLSKISCTIQCSSRIFSKQKSFFLAIDLFIFEQSPNERALEKCWEVLCAANGTLVWVLRQIDHGTRGTLAPTSTSQTPQVHNFNSSGSQLAASFKLLQDLLVVPISLEVDRLSTFRFFA